MLTKDEARRIATNLRSYPSQWENPKMRRGPEGSKEIAMLTRRFKPMALAQLLVVGCAVVFGACIQHAQAQQQFVPPPPPVVPPPPPPVFNPSPPNTTVPQPSYKPISPATPSAVPGSEVTLPVNEGLARPAARSYRRVHHYRGRSTPVTYRCGWYGCVRTYPWAFPCQYYSSYCAYGYYRPYGWYWY